jgi:hypothetical protein
MNRDRSNVRDYHEETEGALPDKRATVGFVVDAGARYGWGT